MSLFKSFSFYNNFTKIAHFYSSDRILNSIKICPLLSLISNGQIGSFPLSLLKVHYCSKFLKVLAIANVKMRWQSVPQADADQQSQEAFQNCGQVF